jgi:hypothetical protein
MGPLLFPSLSLSWKPSRFCNEQWKCAHLQLPQRQQQSRHEQEAPLLLVQLHAQRLGQLACGLHAVTACGAAAGRQPDLRQGWGEGGGVRWSGEEWRGALVERTKEERSEMEWREEERVQSPWARKPHQSSPALIPLCLPLLSLPPSFPHCSHPIPAAGPWRRAKRQWQRGRGGREAVQKLPGRGLQVGWG